MQIPLRIIAGGLQAYPVVRFRSKRQGENGPTG